MNTENNCLILYLFILSFFIYFFYTEKELRPVIFIGTFFLTGFFIFSLNKNI